MGWSRSSSSSKGVVVVLLSVYSGGVAHDVDDDVP